MLRFILQSDSYPDMCQCTLGHVNDPPAKYRPAFSEEHFLQAMRIGLQGCKAVRFLFVMLIMDLLCRSYNVMSDWGGPWC